MVQRKLPGLFEDEVMETEGRRRLVSNALGAEILRRQGGASRTISDLYISDALIAIKESAKCESLEALKARLIQVLSQNSEETRIRNARFVIRWFFPDGIDGVANGTKTSCVLVGFPSSRVRGASHRR